VAAGQNLDYGYADVVPGSDFRAVLSGGTGDADLYVNFGAPATTSSYACRPYRTGNEETCALKVPSTATRAYVMVRGYTAASYNLSLTYYAP
jgi:hypothetical protein